MDIPILTAESYALNNIVTFICLNEARLTEYGAMKIHTTQNCELALKKRKTSPVSVLIQRANRVHENELVYTIVKRDRSDFNADSKTSPIANEQAFWHALAHSNTNPFQSDVIVSPNKSLFYEKWHRRYFTTYQLPRQSLLSLSNNNLIHHCLPTLAQGHGPGAIFPLAVARHGLPLLVYHHGGGARHWYAIRGEHREALMNLLQRCHGAQCIQHDSLFVDPSVLDKNYIPYRYFVQYPNELLVLDAGVIAQSFTTDVHWSESIPFGLPTWIRNGHAHAHQSLCRCNQPTSMLPDPIDFYIFTEERISQYIQKQVDDFYKMKPSSSSSATQTVQPKFLTSATHLLSPVSSNSSGDNHVSTNGKEEYQRKNTGVENQCDLDEVLKYLTGEENDMIDVPEFADRNCFDEYWSPTVNDRDHLSDFHNLNTPSIGSWNEVHGNAYRGSSKDSCPTEPESDSCMEASDESSNLSAEFGQTNHLSASYQKNCHSTKSTDEQNLSTTLFVSGLKYNVEKVDLYKHFLGSIKISLKPCLTVPHLKYAFIEHKTPNQAARNLKRRIDSKLLGRECFIQYACDDQSSSSASSYRVSHERTVAVTQIPQNVTKSELNSVFQNGVIVKYCPARTPSRNSRVTSDLNSNDLLNGFAFIVFNTAKEATDIVQNADRFRINGQALGLSILSETEQF